MYRTLIACAFIATSTSAEALAPLHKDPTVLNGFYAIGLADEVRKNCDSIQPRLIRAYNYLRALQQYAKDQGYSDAQIDELKDNKAEKEKLRTRIRADLAARGASPKSPEGYCTVGLEEIAKGSAAGKLLRAR